ncbi:MAG: hypothetical protein N3D20_02165 [Candidatus Pacearchaeota archaeon]|nr:hypothetical protein [Candidatus Pacearchaeota archaeon]
MKKNESFKAIVQIILLIGMIFAFSYFIRESFEIREKNVIEQKKNSKSKIEIFMLFYEKLVKSIFSEKGLVSAQEEVIATCIETKDGKYCQEYNSSICNSICKDNCIPLEMDETEECKIGTCFDNFEGNCIISPKKRCEQKGGIWYNEPNGNVNVCEKRCCIIGEKTEFVTEKRCEILSKRKGIEMNFKREITNEIDCWLATKTQEEGACIIGKEDDYNVCKFGTRQECEQKRGEFYPNYLCSNPELKTKCERQKSSGCVKGKDEVYWFDSCGNRENIYDANKARSWNNGMVLSKEKSCSLGTANNPFMNRGTCGNCDYMLGSICGNKTNEQKLDDSMQNFVCRDLSCIDEWGNKREHGETWCHYQSLTGIDNKTMNAMDLPGSRHFVMSCVDGVVRIQPCQDYRAEVCREARIDIGMGKLFSQAGCSANRGSECVEINEKLKEKKADKTKIFEECIKNPDCYIKNVSISKKFAVAECAPKYPVGFNRDREDIESVEEKCGFATKKCKVAEVKTTSGWDCKVNCDCLKEEFIEKMNDMCISLGDCGGKANYLGDYVKNFKVSKQGNSKTKNLKKLLNYDAGKEITIIYANETKDNFIDINPYAQLYAEILLKNESLTEKFLKIISKIKGTSGSTTAILKRQVEAKQGPASLKIAGAIVGGPIGLILLGTGNANILDRFSRGLSEEEVNALTALVYAPWTAPYAIIAVIIMVYGIGIGDTNRVSITYECLPWQAKYGGENCWKCGSDGLPCGKYACESLGRECKYFDESETGIASCRWVNKNDVVPPKIKQLDGVLPEGYSYVDITDRGFTIKTNEEDGCIKSYYKFNFGIALDKLGQCSYIVSGEETEEIVAFDDMHALSGGLFKDNHKIEFFVPSPESFGATLSKPNEKIDFKIFIKCRNGNGYENPVNYVVSMCIKPGEDNSGPIVLGKIPEINFVKADTNLQEISIFVNEPAECKWDYENKDYESMKNVFDCADEDAIRFKSYLAYECNATINLIKNEENIYVRCIDQPWLKGVDEGKRNTMTNSYSFTLKKTNPLKITNIEPGNGSVLVSGVEPMSVKLSLKTTGGLNGNAKCSYKVGESFIRFMETGKNVHKQIFNAITRNDIFGSEEKRIVIKCEDEIGNVAEDVSLFSVRIDNEEPKITRVYNKNNVLYVITNEKAECVYSFEKCDFNYANGTLMQGNAFVHSENFAKKQTRYIMCKDEFENKPGQCAISVRGVNF